MKRKESYSALALLNATQRRAGVEDAVRELVNAYARTQLDARQDAQFDWPAPPAQDVEDRHPALRDWLCATEPLSEQFRAFLFVCAESMRTRGVEPLLSIEHLAWTWRMSGKQVWWWSANAQEMYRTFRIRKSRGGFRTIDAPRARLKARQRWILNHCLCDAVLSPAVTAFRRHSSIVSNAKPHVGKAVVVRIDLRDFFPSITHRQVRKAFESLGYPYRVAVALAGFCTLRGRLPQGSPCSPALANLVCRRLDARLLGLAACSAFTYTRYADDLTFSSDRRELPALIPLFRRIVSEEGFEVHEEKLQVMRPSVRQVVTGITVNEKLNLSRDRYRKLRAMADRYRKQAPDAPTQEELAGHLSFAESLSPEKARKLRAVAYGV